MAIIAGILLIVSIVLILPKNLSYIDGFPYDKLQDTEPTNLLKTSQNALSKSKKTLTFTEQQVNDYLNYRIQASQGSGGFMKIRGIYIDFRPNEAEIIIVRSIPIFGKNTVSTVITKEYDDTLNRDFWKTEGFSAGKFSWAKGTIAPIHELALKISKLASEEIQLIDAMRNVEFGEDQVVLKTQPR